MCAFYKIQPDKNKNKNKNFPILSQSVFNLCCDSATSDGRNMGQDLLVRPLCQQAASFEFVHFPKRPASATNKFRGCDEEINFKKKNKNGANVIVSRWQSQLANLQASGCVHLFDCQQRNCFLWRSPVSLRAEQILLRYGPLFIFSDYFLLLLSILLSTFLQKCLYFLRLSFKKQDCYFVLCCI